MHTVFNALIYVCFPLILSPTFNAETPQASKTEQILRLPMRFGNTHKKRAAASFLFVVFVLIKIVFFDFSTNFGVELLQTCRR